MKIFICAGNFKEAKIQAANMGIKDWIYVGNRERMMGYRKCKIIFCGNYLVSKPLYEELRNIALAQEFIIEYK